MQLKITTRTIQEIVVLNCDGRIVLGDESAALRDTVRELLAQSKQLVLNLGGVSYIDSGGLGTLVSLYTTAHNAGASIKLSNLTQRVGDLLQVTKLLTIFEVYETEEEAVQSFRKGAAA
jgi:anti-sigma B factor antagonist